MRALQQNKHIPLLKEKITNTTHAHIPDISIRSCYLLYVMLTSISKRKMKKSLKTDVKDADNVKVRKGNKSLPLGKWSILIVWYTSWPSGISQRNPHCWHKSKGKSSAFHYLHLHILTARFDPGTRVHLPLHTPLYPPCRWCHRPVSAGSSWQHSCRCRPAPGNGTCGSENSTSAAGTSATALTAAKSGCIAFMFHHLWLFRHIMAWTL